MYLRLTEFVMKDLPAVLELWRSTEGIGLSAADQPERIESFLARNPGMSFTAWDGEQLIGALLCGHDGRRGYLHHLAVASDYRRMGIGHRILEKALSALTAENIDKAHIFVYADNPLAQKFWQENGWYCRPELVLMSRNIES